MVQVILGLAGHEHDASYDDGLLCSGDRAGRIGQQRLQHHIYVIVDG